jgi:LysR family transcriptional regulator, benzoate and cis,cis-muconate-responsive activator of ben and cat genes
MAPPVQNAADAITLRQLQYFVAVAEDEHFTRASERLLVAQPSLSRHVRELEDWLGIELFIRDTHGVSLTEPGRELLVQARRILAALESTVDAVRSAAVGLRGRLRLGYYGPSFYNNTSTRSALERFRAEAPDIEVTSQELFSEQIVPLLREGRIDVGIGRGVARASDVLSRIIAVERLVVLLPDTDELASKHRIALSDLNGRNLIGFQWELAVAYNERIAEVVRSSNVTLNTVLMLTQLSTIMYHVSCGEGIAIVPSSSGHSPVRGVVTRELSDPHATMDLLAFTRRAEQSPPALRFLDLLGSADRS